MARYFTNERNFTPAAATAIVHHPLAIVRRVVYDLASDVPVNAPGLQVSQEYVALLRDIYMDGPLADSLPPGGNQPQAKQQLLDLLIESGGLSIAQIAERSGCKAGTARERLVRYPERYQPAWAETEWFTYEALECPHAPPQMAHKVDRLLWVPEVPGGLICTSCLKTPRPDSIVYPVHYRDQIGRASNSPARPLGSTRRASDIA